MKPGVTDDWGALSQGEEGIISDDLGEKMASLDLAPYRVKGPSGKRSRWLKSSEIQCLTSDIEEPSTTKASTTHVSETTHISKTTPSTTVATDMGPNYRLSLNDTFNFLKPNNVTTTQSVSPPNAQIKEETIIFSIDETLKKFIKDKLDVISSSEEGSTPTKSKFTCGEN